MSDPPQPAQHLPSPLPKAEDGLLALLLAYLPDGAFVVNADGRIVQLNATAASLFGYDVDDLVGQPVEQLIPTHLVGRHLAHRAEFQAQPRTRPMGAGPTLLGRRRDGNEIPVDITLGPFQSAEGPAVLCLVRDITERAATAAERERLLAVAERQSAQLRALYDAGLALVSNLDIETVLQQAVDSARSFVGARYAALAVFDESSTILRLITSGITDEARTAIGDLPKGRGLLGMVAAAGHPIRVDNIDADAAAIGTPRNHPPMTTFLGVPVGGHGLSLGALYLTDKLVDGQIVAFNDEDETLAQLIAAQIAVAAENARLHRFAQGMAVIAERERIARELHDNLAQVLGFVRLQMGVIRLALIRMDAAAISAAVEQVDSATAESYADVREAILGFRSYAGPGEGRSLAGALRGYIERYRRQSGVDAMLELDEDLRDPYLSPVAEAQLLRIVQEALSNVRKHAAAEHAIVRLQLVPGASGAVLRASVTDDGHGFDPTRVPKGLSFGLLGVRERAEAVGGTLTVTSAPGEGTRILLDLPLDAAPAAGGPHPARSGP